MLPIPGNGASVFRPQRSGRAARDRAVRHDRSRRRRQPQHQRSMRYAPPERGFRSIIRIDMHRIIVAADLREHGDIVGDNRLAEFRPFARRQKRPAGGAHGVRRQSAAEPDLSRAMADVDETIGLNEASAKAGDVARSIEFRE